MKNENKTIRDIVDKYIGFGMGKDNKNEKDSMIRWISDEIKKNYKKFLNDDLKISYTREKMFLKDGAEILVKNLIKIYPYKSFIKFLGKKTNFDEVGFSKLINTYDDEIKILDKLKLKSSELAGIYKKNNSIDIVKTDLDTLENTEINLKDYEVHLGSLELSLYFQIYELKASLRKDIYNPFLYYKLAYLYYQIGENQKAFDSINLAIDNFLNFYNKKEKEFKEKDVKDFNKFASIMFDMDEKYEGSPNVSYLLNDKNDDDVNYADNLTFCIFFPQHLFVLKNEILASLLDSLNNFKINDKNIEDELTRKINTEKYKENEFLKGRYKKEYYQTSMACFYWSVKTYDPVFNNFFLLSHGASKLFYNYLCNYNYEKYNFSVKDKGIFLSLYKLIKDSQRSNLFSIKEYSKILRDIYKGETYENSEILFYSDLIKILAKISLVDLKIELDNFIKIMDSAGPDFGLFEFFLVRSHISHLIIEHKGSDEYKRIYTKVIEKKIEKIENEIVHYKNVRDIDLDRNIIFNFEKYLVDNFLEMQKDYNIENFLNLKKDKDDLIISEQKSKRRKKEIIKNLYLKDVKFTEYLNHFKNIANTDDISIKLVIAFVEIINKKNLKANVNFIKKIIFNETTVDEFVKTQEETFIDRLNGGSRDIEKIKLDFNGTNKIIKEDLKSDKYKWMVFFPLHLESIVKAVNDTSFYVEFMKNYRIKSLGGGDICGIENLLEIQISNDINKDSLAGYIGKENRSSVFCLQKSYFHIEHIKELIHLTRDSISKQENGYFTQKDYETFVEFYLSLKSKMIYADVV